MDLHDLISSDGHDHYKIVGALVPDESFCVGEEYKRCTRGKLFVHLDIINIIVHSAPPKITHMEMMNISTNTVVQKYTARDVR